jgi:uncharacterized protein (TIGR00299 family) protein
MHIHLDPVGGVAGEMFAAAILDAWPELETGLRTALDRAGLTRLARIARRDHTDHALSGSRFVVERVSEASDGHRHYGEIRDLLKSADMEEPVRARALAIFALLAQAESEVHGVPVDQVSFHEVGSWDSIADVCCAAWLIEALGAPTWSSAPLPKGSGRVQTAHGRLPVPAPASAILLRGFPLVWDEHPGERVTPTGAAIMRHLSPVFEPMREPMVLTCDGTGFGTSTFDGMSNVLRLLAFERQDSGLRTEPVSALAFEVDDQSGEDLAFAVEQLRALDGVLDVTQSAVIGKKGRMAARVQVLARPSAAHSAVEACFEQTTTLGVRHHAVERTVLARSRHQVEVDGLPVRVKAAKRPRGAVTVKAEMDDVARAPGGRAARQRLRAAAESDEGQRGRVAAKDAENPENA